MVHVHFEGTPDQVRTEMHALLGGTDVHISNAGSTLKLAKKEKTAEAPAETKAPEPTSSGKATFQDVKEIIPRLMDKLGKPGIIKFLADFDGAKKGSEIKESRYAEFVEKAKAALA
jgi:hypothetical protein